LLYNEEYRLAAQTFLADEVSWKKWTISRRLAKNNALRVRYRR